MYIALTKQTIAKIAVCIAAALALAAASVSSAHAVCVYGTMSLECAATSLTMDAGQSTTVTCVADPLSQDQTPTCDAWYCPDGCGDIGCLDKNNMCICFGSEYDTYYTTVTATSSDPTVATATWSDGVLSVNAISDGVTTITVNADLKNWNGATKEISVQVGDATPTPSNEGASNTEGGNTVVPGEATTTNENQASSSSQDASESATSASSDSTSASTNASNTNTTTNVSSNTLAKTDDPFGIMGITVFIMAGIAGIALAARRARSGRF